MGIIIKALEKIKSFFSRDAILSKALVQGRQISVGSDTQIIFNSGGILSASSNFVWNSGLGINTSSIVGVLNVSGNTSETLPIVNLITSSANNWMRGIRMLAANMGSGNSILYCLGKADSSRNMGQFYYYHSGDGSTSNRVSIGLHSVDDVLNVMGGGIVGIGTTNPSGKLHIYSTDTGSAGKLIVHSASGSYGQLQIASTNSEASIGFNASASTVGSSPTSGDGNSHLWGVGPGVFGMDGCEFGICNTEYGAPIITIRSSGRVAIGAGTTVGDINTRLKVIENAAQGVVSITNLHASGYSCIEFQNSGKTNVGGVGYGNASVGVSALQGKMYLYAESGIDTVINCNGTTLAYFKSDGKIALGSSAPTTEKLEVSGAVIIGARSGSMNGTISYASNVFTFRQNGADVTLPDMSLYATLSSPTFTGTPAAPTAALGTDTTQIATTAYVQNELDNLPPSSSSSVISSINQNTHGLSVNNPVKLSAGSYAKAKADTEANAEVVGIVSAVADADNFTLLTEGYYTSTGHGLTVDSIYFLSESTAGALTSTAPSTAGQINKPCVYVKDANTLYFHNWRGIMVSANDSNDVPVGAKLYMFAQYGTI